MVKQGEGMGIIQPIRGVTLKRKEVYSLYVI